MCSLAIPWFGKQIRQAKADFFSTCVIMGSFQESKSNVAQMGQLSLHRHPKLTPVELLPSQVSISASLPSVSKNLRKQVAAGLMFDGGNLKPATRKSLMEKTFIF